MRKLIAVLLSAALIHFIPHVQAQSPSQINNVDRVPKVQTVQAEAPRKEPTATLASKEKAPTEPKAKPLHPVTRTRCDAYRNIISRYSWNVNVAIAVCNAESNGNPTNDNPTDRHPTCRGSRGLFQIGCDSTDNYAGMFSASANIHQAYKLYARRGWEPWSSTTCRYKVACY